MTLIEEGFPAPGPMDVAVSRSILAAVADGEMGSVFRLHTPGPVVAFGRSDRADPGYADAVRASSAHGFSPVERLAGGRAAVFHESTLAFSWAIPDPEPRLRTVERFATVADVIAEALRSLDVDARIGELPGEYCPGAWSINVGGRVKVMGVGQRLVRNAAHVGGVVVVDDGHRVRDVLTPVYRALAIDWKSATAGSLADSVPGLTNREVATAIAGTLGRRFGIESGTIPRSVVDRAGELVNDHFPRVA